MSYVRGIITTYASEADIVVEWKIENFTNLPKEDTHFYYDGKFYISPDFSFGGERWFLVIFPNGWSENYSSGEVDLELCKWPTGRSIKRSFSLSLKTAEGEKYNEQHFSKDFDNHKYFHRFNRLIPRWEHSRRRSDLVPEGTLTVICTMKSSTSAGSDTGKYTEHPFVEAPTQSVDASTQTVEASIETVEAPTQSVDASTQTVEASIETVEASIETVEEKCKDCASGSSIGPHVDELRHDLKELFLKKEDCDIIIKVKDSEFPAHRVILKARSPVFASTFRHDMKENTTGVLEIQDCDSSTFSDFLCFLYCGEVGIISQENVFGLFTAADKYQVLNLRAKCLEFMKKNITVDTFCETLTLALRHSETELIKLSTDYFNNNISKIIVTVKWQLFLAENPTESNELLVKCFVPNSSCGK